MTADTYRNFDELTRHEKLNKDYQISIRDVGSIVTIIAPHGGKIEPRTSDVAKRIAENNYNYYCFEGIKPNDNGSLHITSHHFDEPTAVNLISRSRIVLAIHACIGIAGLVYLGGLDKEITKAIANELETREIRVSMRDPRFKGLHPDNICNRGLTQKGVQLEITRGVRDDRNKIELIVEAVQTALEKILKKTDGLIFKFNINKHFLRDF